MARLYAGLQNLDQTEPEMIQDQQSRNQKEVTRRQFLPSAAKCWLLWSVVVAGLVAHVPADSGAAGQASHPLKKGETLWGVAAQVYGNRHYDKLIALHNRIARPERIPAGTVLRVPDLSAVLAEAGLAPRYSAGIDLLLEIYSEYRIVEQELDDLHRAAGRTTVQLSAKTRAHLDAAAGAADAAIEYFSRPGEGAARPDRLIGQLRSLSSLLGQLAGGANDGYGYDLDMVHQHLAWAMQNACRWAEKGFSN